MEELGLWEHRDKFATDLSGGLKQRFIIGMALVADSELLFLDEPTIGLDPLGRRAVWHMVRNLAKCHFGLVSMSTLEIAIGWIYLMAFAVIMAVQTTGKARWVDP